MIEVELKLEVNKFPDVGNLQLVKENHIVDVYYDTPDYKLISTGNFLRNRDNKNVDFKLNVGDLTHTYCKETNFKYAGFTHPSSLQQIFKNIGLKYSSNFNSFEEFLKVNNLSQLAVIDKYRKVYKFEDLEISFDEAKDIGNFIEIEYDLPDGSEVNREEIVKYMLDKMTANNLIADYSFVKIGYVELYLKKHNPHAYNLGLYKD